MSRTLSGYLHGSVGLIHYSPTTLKHIVICLKTLLNCLKSETYNWKILVVFRPLLSYLKLKIINVHHTKLIRLIEVKLLVRILF
jgi:hypothetical protein